MVNATSDAEAVQEVRAALFAEGVVPVLIAPTGGTVGKDLVAHRTYAASSSTELDAIVLACAATSAADAVPSLDAKGRKFRRSCMGRPAGGRVGHRGVAAREGDRRLGRRPGCAGPLGVCRTRPQAVTDGRPATVWPRRCSSSSPGPAAGSGSSLQYGQEVTAQQALKTLGTF